MRNLKGLLIMKNKFIYLFMKAVTIISTIVLLLIGLAYLFQPASRGDSTIYTRVNAREMK